MKTIYISGIRENIIGANTYVYYDEKNKIVFSGDTLFFESIGRTDFYTGDSQKIITSIKQKLFSLSEEVKVFCGHGQHTTIGHEKKYNLQVR